MSNLAYVQITRRCNQECRFCSNPPNDYLDRPFLEVNKIIKGLRANGYAGVILTGGEPTLYADLGKILEFCKVNNFPCRIITNGQQIADLAYLKKLLRAGLFHIHLSLYSVRKDIQSFLTNNPNSLNNIIRALENLRKVKKITTDINIVISSYNANHLYENVSFLVENFSFVRHFVFNNLDPLMNRAAKNRDTIPKLNAFELQLSKAMHYLLKNKKTFRVERVPLCYMSDFWEFSTETRKIVKEEDRLIYFLDNKGIVRQNEIMMWFYDKGKSCDYCSLNEICAGLYEMDNSYSSGELYPLFMEKTKIIEKIKCS